MGHIKIVENPSEIGAGTRGASLGIGALKVVAHNLRSDFFARFERFTVENENEQLNKASVFNYAKRIDGLFQVYQRTADIVSFIVSNGDFPLVLAGDHASAGGTIAGLVQANPSKRLGVIWVDAHADLHTPYTTPSGNIHGMPLATAFGLDNLDCQINTPLPETIKFWGMLKNLGNVCPKLKAEDLVFIGVRDTENAEEEFIARNNIKNYPVAELREAGIEQMIQQIKEKLKYCDYVYVSFDVDSMDSILVSKGTGTPVGNGLTSEEAKTIMNALAAWEKVNCIEVVEINPCLDDKVNKMAETAFEIIESFTPLVEKRI